MIIGITGTIGAGKTTVVEILEKNGFTHFSARTFLTVACVKENQEPNRDNLREMANKLRSEHGPEYVIKSLYELATKHKGNVVIESVRSVGEVTFLKQQAGFKLVSVDADSLERYERVIKRQSATDNVSFEKFVSQEEAENNNTSPFMQNLSACMELADIHIKNTHSIEELEKIVITELNL